MVSFLSKKQRAFHDAGLTAVIVLATFFFSLLVQRYYSTQNLIPMVFVLATFLVSVITDGYLWGVISSLLSVLALNFAFTFPYFQFNFTIPENFFSAVVTLSVSIITSTLTTKIQIQEKMKVLGEKEQLRANLLRGISHDLRTPLTSIYGSCSTIVENYDLLSKNQQLKLLNEIQQDAEWLIRMVENLLSVTRVDSSSMALSKSSTVLDELIDSVLIKFQKRFPGQDVQLDIPDGFTSLRMDALLIEQVMMNLLENAVRHAQGMTELSLHITTSDGQALFVIEDNGCGIPRERLATLFSGYSRDGTAPADGSRGMGIGLSVCAAIIRAHGGKIWAENRKEGGARFCFTLETEEDVHEQ